MIRSGLIKCQRSEGSKVKGGIETSLLNIRRNQSFLLILSNDVSLLNETSDTEGGGR